MKLTPVFGALVLFAMFSFSSPAVAGSPKTRTNSIGMEFVLVPAGDFYMGSCNESETIQAENRRRAFIGQPLLEICPSGAEWTMTHQILKPLNIRFVSAKHFIWGSMRSPWGSLKNILPERDATVC